MKGLLASLLVGFLAFQLLAIAQEWETFAGSWLGSSPPAPALGDGQRQAALGVLREVLTLSGHLYASGGDRRFAERMPASPAVVDGMLDEIAYLNANRRRQASELEALTVLAVEPLGGERVEVRTRERWLHRTLWPDGSEADPPRRQTLYGRYLLARSGAAWKLEGWEPVSAPTRGAG